MIAWGSYWRGTPLQVGARVWVLGAAGQLGQACCQVLGTVFDVRGFSRTEWDITQPTDVQRWLFEGDPRERPNCIVNCAAITRVDACEESEDLAMTVNGHGPGLLAHACERIGIVLVQVSTDYVFDGTRSTPYEETDPPAPVNVYGRTKLQGEQQVVRQMASGEFLIVRTSWIFSPYRPNFVVWLLDRVRQGQTVRVAMDQTGGPSWAYDVADAIGVLLRQGYRGWFHFRNEGVCTRYEQAVYIVETFGFPKEQVQPVSIQALGLRAPRPMHSVLSIARYQTVTGLTPRDWHTIFPWEFERPPESLGD